MKSRIVFRRTCTRNLTAVLLLLAASAASTANAAPAVLDRLEASANSAMILRSDIAKFRKTMPLRAQLDPLFAGTPIATQGSKAGDSDIVKFLLDERIISQQFPITDAEVEQEINSIQSGNKIDRATLKKALTEQGFAFEDYFEMIRSSASKRNLIDRDIRTKVTISDDDVKNHFYNHYSKSATNPLGYRIQMISVSTSNYKAPNAAKEVAERASQAIKGGESFNEVAKRYSDGPTASSGGDLGTVSEENMSPEIRKEVKKLQIGQVSGVFGGPQTGGYFILKLVDVKTTDTDRFDQVKDEIRNQLMAAEYQRQIGIWLERQRQSASIHVVGGSSLSSGVKSLKK